MTSLVFDSFWNDLATGAVDADTDTFKCLLTTSGYTENKGTHAKRSDVTSEVAAGGGYSAGGAAITVTVGMNTTTHLLTITLGGFTLSAATVTARKAVIYKSRGGASSADNLVAVIDFGSDVVSTNGNWTLGASTITVQN